MSDDKGAWSTCAATSGKDQSNECSERRCCCIFRQSLSFSSWPLVWSWVRGGTLIFPRILTLDSITQQLHSSNGPLRYLWWKWGTVFPITAWLVRCMSLFTPPRFVACSIWRPDQGLITLDSLHDSFAPASIFAFVITFEMYTFLFVENYMVRDNKYNWTVNKQKSRTGNITWWSVALCWVVEFST